eukprot:TRINITY_DN14940_c0_g1_i5.p1 TRINITY_DN14940_c0_g1~~TRINITY_DN14940_c0_g1_i5.p1  ORF type:complete len:1817 (-),score=266.15 TRINITY_DN14940_c0_g1_i5:59-5452(-)
MIEAIAKLIFLLIVKVLELSTWVIAFILLLLSCCVPWRIPSVIYTLLSIEDIEDYRCVFAFCFFCTLVDLITLPLGITSMLMPTMTIDFCSVTCHTCSLDSWTGRVAGDFFALRGFFFCSFFAAVIDLVLLPLGIFQALVPSRTYFFLTKVLLPVFCHTREDGRQEKHFDENRYCELRYKWFCGFWLALLDIVCALSGLVVFGTLLRCRVLYLDFQAARENTGTTLNALDYALRWRIVFLRHGLMAIRDLICLPWGILSCLAPTRVGFFCKVTFSAYCPRRKESEDLQKNTDVSDLWWMWLANCVLAVFDFFAFLFGFVAFAFLVRSCQTYREFREAFKSSRERAEWEERMQYNRAARLVLVANGATMLLDLFFLPFIAMIGVTFVRLQPVVESLRKEMGWKTRVLIMREFSRLMVDIVLMPALVLLLLTIYRACPVFSGRCCWRRSRKNDEEERNREQEYFVPTDHQLRLMRATFFLFCDLLVSPFIFILVLTCYRAGAVCRAASEYPDSLYFHCEVLKAFLNFLVDLPFVFMGLFVMITVYRIDFLCAGLMKGESSWDCRWVTWVQFGNVLRDLVCLLLLLLIFLTLYRLPSWCAKLKVAACKPLDGLPKTTVTSVALVLQRPGKGKPKLLIGLQKDVNFCSVKKIRLRVLGSEFYRIVGKAFGNLVGSGAQAVATSLTLTTEQVDVSVIASGCENVCLEVTIGGDYSFGWIMEQVNHLEFVSNPAKPVSMLVQLEASLNDGQQVVLAVAVVPFTEISSAIRAEYASDAVSPATCHLSMSSLKTDEGSIQGLRREVGNFRDAWPFFTVQEAKYVVEDLFRLCWHCFHILLLSLLVLVPHRGFLAIKNLFQTHAKVKTGRMKRQLAYMEELDVECHNVAIMMEALLKANSKAAIPKPHFLNASRTGTAYSEVDRATYCVEGCIGCCCCIICPCCPNYFDTRQWFCEDDELEDQTTINGHPMWQRNPKVNFGKRLADVAKRTDALGSKFEECATKCDMLEEADAKELQQRYVRQVFVLWYDAFFWMIAGARVQERFAQKWNSQKLSSILTSTEKVEQADDLGSPLVQVCMNSSPPKESHERESREQQRQRRKYYLEMERLTVTTDKMRAKARKSLQDLVEVRGEIRTRWPKLEKMWAEDSARAPCRLAPGPHSIITHHFLGAVGDILALPFLMLIVLTLYRLPGFCQDAQRSRLPLFRRVRAALMKHVVGLMQDVFALLQLILLTAILVGTVVKLPDFLYGFNPFKGLHRLVRWALLNVAELVMGIMEVFMLLTLWKSYRMVVSGLIFGLFAPPAVLAVAALPQCLNQTSRFVITCPFWAAWLACIIVFSVMEGMWSFGFAVGFIGVPFVLSLVGIAANAVPGWVKPRLGDWWSPQVRVSPLNALALVVVAVEAVMLGVAITVPKDSATHDSEWLSLAALGDQKREHLAIPSVCIMGASVLVAALPIIAYDDDERESLICDPRWVVGTNILLELLFLPVTWAAWPSLVAIDASWPLILLFVYYIFSAVMLPAICESPLKPEARLDIRYTGLYAAGHKMLLLAAVAAAWASQTTIFLVSATALFFWTLVFVVHGCSVPWVQVLRLGISSGVLVSLRITAWYASILVWSVCLVIAVLTYVISKLRRRRSCEREALPAILALLRKSNARSSLWGDTYSLRLSDGDSPQFIARELLAMEVALPFERLQLTFTAARENWRSRLLQAKDYSVVHTAADELARAIFVPPPANLLSHLLSKVPACGKFGLPLPLRMEVVAFVGLTDGSQVELCVTSLTPSDKPRSYKCSADLSILWYDTNTCRID